MAEPLDFLAAVDPAARAALEAAATRRGYPRDTVLFHGGDDGGTMIVLLSGQVKITVPTRRERDTILGFSGPGELLGEIPAVDGGPRSATATAIEPVEALGIPRSAFAGILAREPSMSGALLGVLAARLREADRQRAEYAGYDVLGRVARRLVELAERFGRPRPRGPRDHPRDHPAGARRMDRRIAGGDQQGADHAALPGVGRDPPAAPRRPRPRGAAQPRRLSPAVCGGLHVRGVAKGVEAEAAWP